ncbi:MAG: hypothetical protein MUC96_19525 [Myxococcaceae bacterium]|jgi:hypothetical protein|nr:hypothetical protein [Myxococcaceae bacterium]
MKRAAIFSTSASLGALESSHSARSTASANCFAVMLVDVAIRSVSAGGKQ